jgi:hypothetical protein
MKNYRKMACVFTIIALFLMGATVAAEEKKPSGTIHLEEEQFMFILGGDSGSGTLDFKGKIHGFTTAGITAGGVGYQKISASGDVYHLNKVSDFPGTYVAARAGLAVAEGKGGEWLQNSKGVYIHLKTSQEGLALGFGVEGLTIMMK